MDTRIRDQVLRRREELLERECLLLEEAQESIGAKCYRSVDVGCGPYSLPETNGDRLPVLRAGSIGIDLDRVTLSQNPNITHRVCANCYSLPFATASLDFVVCRWVFEHLEKPEEAIREFSRVLKRGGFLYIKTPNLWNYGMLLSWATPTVLHNIFRGVTGVGENSPTFYRANTRKKLERLARNTAFVVRRMEFQSYSYMYYSFNKELFLMMRTLSETMGALTQKTQQTLLCLMQKVG